MSKEFNKIKEGFNPPGLLIAGTNSGCGKTTVTLALMEAFKRRGIRVCPFKIGPDFIDPGLHRFILGTASHNLDTWMLSSNKVKELYNSVSKGFDLSIVEGVMGLYDGASGRSEEGSSAHIAKLLGLKVLLVVNARSMARSVAALIKGFIEFDPQVEFLGVILNNVGSKNHKELLFEAIEPLGLDFIGSLSRDPNIILPSRHLGLVTAEENPFSDEFKENLFNWISSGVDIDCLYKKLAKSKKGKVFDLIKKDEKEQPVSVKVKKIKKTKRLAVSWDKAFCFLYQANLNILKKLGVKIEFFSPLKDKRLPPKTKGLYLCGGYPELYAKELSRNVELLQTIKEFIEDNGRVYAECGGMIYLSQGIRTKEKVFKFSSILPFWTKMSERLSALGYREVKFLKDCFIANKGTITRGHEFHYSFIDIEEEKKKEALDEMNIYEVFDRKGKKIATKGFLYKSCLASYVHLHFLSNIELCEKFVTSL